MLDAETYPAHADHSCDAGAAAPHPALMRRAIAAYSAGSQLGLAGQDLQAEVLIRTGAALQRVHTQWDDGQEALPAALHRSAAVWRVLSETPEAIENAQERALILRCASEAFALIAKLKTIPNRTDLGSLLGLHRKGATRRQLDMAKAA